MTLNTDVLSHLIELGYSYTYHEADFYDDGDAESGPHLAGGPAYHEFQSEDDYIIFDDKGHFEFWEKRDLELEAWENEHNPDLYDAYGFIIDDDPEGY